MKNTGKRSEQIWVEAFARLGKRSFTHRFVDASEIVGKTGKVAISASSQPSDFLLVLDGKTYFSEVKSTQNETSFPFGLLKKSQLAQGQMLLAAGGDYLVFVHALATGGWYCIPLPVILKVQAEGNSSIKWPNLAPYNWNLNAKLS